MEFNDSVTFVDYPGELERRELEVLIKLVPFVERDVEERCARFEEMKEENLRAIDSEVYANSDNRKGARRMVEERYEKAIREEGERLVRLRRAILERAGRVFPELAAEEPQDKGESFSSGAQGEDGSLPARERESASGVSYVAGVVPGSRTEVP